MNEEVRHLRELRLKYQNRLRELELMRANFGFNTPPEINIEIRDLEGRIKNIDNNIKLNQEGAELASSGENPTPPLSPAENRKEPFTTSRAKETGSNNTISNSSISNSSVHQGDEYIISGSIIHFRLSDVVSEEGQDFSQIISLIGELEINTRHMSLRVNDFSYNTETLLSAVGNISIGEFKSKSLDILRDFENTFLKYALFVNKTNKQYEIAIRQTEAGLRKFLNIDYLTVYIPKEEVLNFISSIKEAERKIVALRNILLEFIKQIRKCVIPETIRSDLNKAIELCTENISDFDILVQMNQQLFWRVRGMAEGLLNSAG